jgi:hypothetical protein
MPGNRVSTTMRMRVKFHLFALARKEDNMDGDWIDQDEELDALAQEPELSLDVLFSLPGICSFCGTGM